MSKMAELDTDLETIRRVMAEPNDIAAPMAVRDLMSATLTLSELAFSKSTAGLVRLEANDIELAYTRLGRLLSNIRRQRTEAA